MRAEIGLFTLCRAVAGLSAKDTVPAAATNVKDPVYICPKDPNMQVSTARFDIPVKLLELLFRNVVLSFSDDRPPLQRSDYRQLTTFHWSTV